MKNLLRVEGTSLEDLSAVYQNRTFDKDRITGGVAEGHAAIVLHFASRLAVPDNLNVILLITDCKGKYRATGLSAYDRGDGKPQFYMLGDDLEIIVDPSADKAIRSLND